MPTCFGGGGRHDRWITLSRRRDLWPHQTAVFVETDSVQSRQKRCSGRLCWQLQLLTPLCVLSTTLTHTHSHKATCLKSVSEYIYIYKKKRDVPICPSSSGISVQYWSISESIGSHYLSSVTYLNCYGCDCCQSSSQLRVFSGSSFMEPGKRRRLASPNKDISSPCKSMLTACLPRLGDSPTLWFLIRHIMKREEIGIWVEDCVIGQADLIVFAFHLPPLMEMILIDKSPCRG